MNSLLHEALLILVNDEETLIKVLEILKNDCNTNKLFLTYINIVPPCSNFLYYLLIRNFINTVFRTIIGIIFNKGFEITYPEDIDILKYYHQNYREEYEDYELELKTLVYKLVRDLALSYLLNPEIIKLWNQLLVDSKFNVLKEDILNI